MPVQYKSFTGALDTAGEGSIVAEFSRFDIPDLENDITLKSFFTDGQPVPMVHDHDWSHVIGKGVIEVGQKSAVFNGALFLDTIAGREAYTTIRNLGDLQEYSYGYLATDTERSQYQGKSVRLLKGGKTYEVSDTLVGCMPGTRTLGIKSRGVKGMYVEPEIEGSYEDLAEDIAEAMTAQNLAPSNAYVSTVATFAGYAYVAVTPRDSYDQPTYYRVEYTLDDAGDPLLSNATEVEPGVVFTPTTDLSFVGQSLKALAAVERLATRTSALAALRAERKSGRVLSAANHGRLTAVHDGIAAHLSQMATVLAAHDPKADPQADKKSADVVDDAVRAERQRLWLEHLRLEARLNGVAV